MPSKAIAITRPHISHTETLLIHSSLARISYSSPLPQFALATLSATIHPLASKPLADFVPPPF